MGTRELTPEAYQRLRREKEERLRGKRRRIFYITNDENHYWDGQDWTPIEWQAREYTNPRAAMHQLQRNKKFKKHKRKIIEKLTYIQLELF